MPIKSAADASLAWKNAGTTAGPKWTAGVQATTKDPGALAAAQVQKLLTNLTAAIQSGKWQRRVTDGGPQKWKNACADKQPNFVQGFTAGQGNYQTAYNDMLPTMTATQTKIQGMAKVTLADSIARAAEWMTDLHNYRLNRQ